MAEPFLAEIRIMSFNFAPKGWSLCNGQLLPINQNQALFSIIGTTWGGDGRVTFALPNLQGQVPIHVGNGHALGPPGIAEKGETAHTLTVTEMPTHSHVAQAVTPAGNIIIPINNMLATSPAKPYDAPTGLTNLIPSTVSNAGGGQAHENMQPFLTLSFCIALQGIFPSPT